MTPTECLCEIERRSASGDQRGAYALWIDHRDERFDASLTADEQRRLRGVLHVLMQMAAGLGWDIDSSVAAPLERRTV